MLKFVLFLVSSVVLFAQERGILVESMVYPSFLPPEVIRKPKSPTVSVLLSSLAPGLGHYYIGENCTANELLTGGVLSGACVYASKHDPSFMRVNMIQVY